MVTLIIAAAMQTQLLGIPSRTVQHVEHIPRDLALSLPNLIGSGLIATNGRIFLAPRYEMLTHANAAQFWKLKDASYAFVELVQVSKAGILVLATKNQILYLDQQGGSELLKPEPRAGFAQADTQVLDADSLDSVTIAHAAWGGDLDSMYERRGGISRISLTDQDPSACHLIYEPKIGAVTHAVASRDGSEFLARVTIQIHTKQFEEHIWRVVSKNGKARDVPFPNGWLAASFDTGKLIAILFNENGQLAKYDFKRKRLKLLPQITSAEPQLRHIALGNTLLVSIGIGTYELATDDTWRKVAEGRIIGSSRNGNVLLLTTGNDGAALIQRSQ